MKGAAAILTLALLLLSTTPIVSAQEEFLPDELPLYDFRVEFSEGPQLELESGQASPLKQITVTIFDTSRDSAPPGDAGLGSSVNQRHTYSFEVVPVYEDPDWQVQFSPAAITVAQGSSGKTTMLVGASLPQNEYFLFKVNVTLSPQYCCGSKSLEFNFQAHVAGIQQLASKVIGGPTARAGPDEIVNFDLQYTNLALVGNNFEQRVVSNNCGLAVTLNSFYLDALERKTVQVQVLTPNDKMYYAQSSCGILLVANSADGTVSKSTPLTVQVQGFYFDPGTILNFLIFIAVVAGIIWFLLAAKRRTEEEVLGKPQPPWTLPAEQIYLTELGKKDPQAAYVVRHFLMEDEYHSSLLWYKAYKHATRGRRAVERKVLRLEHKFEKWDLKQQEQLAKTDDSTEVAVEKLQAKLDKKVRKGNKAELKAWKKEVAKLESKAANDHNKALGAWKTDAKKAKKTGQPEPKRPAPPVLDLPDEPVPARILLDDHKWSTKKERILTGSDKKEDKAHARYEAAREKKQRALRRSMEKLANKIDDPEFVKEHPLLQGSSA